METFLRINEDEWEINGPGDGEGRTHPLVLVWSDYYPGPFLPLPLAGKARGVNLLLPHWSVLPCYPFILSFTHPRTSPQHLLPFHSLALSPLPLTWSLILWNTYTSPLLSSAHLLSPTLYPSSLLTQTPLENWLSCYLFSFWSLLVQVQVLGYSWNLLVSLDLVKSSSLGTDGQVSSTCIHHQTANHRLTLGFPLVICKMKVWCSSYFTGWRTSWKRTSCVSVLVCIW